MRVRAPPLRVSTQQSLEDRFYAKVVAGPNGCHMWIGSLKPNGYGQACQTGRTLYAHRVAYEMARGPIPTGLQIDHLCRTRRCVNPDHLEAVTQRENLLRGATVVALNAAKTHCHRGHEFTHENTYVRPEGRRCRRCHTDNQLRYEARKRVAA